MRLDRWQTILNEGKLEWETTQLSRVIVQILKQVIDDINDEVPIKFSLEANNFLDKPVEWLSDVDVYAIAQIMGDDPTIPPVVVNAGYSRSELEPEHSDIEVYIYFPPEPNLKHLAEVIPKLKEVLRHELEHAVQSTETIRQIGGVPDFSSVDDVREKYLSDGEVAAWVSGLYKSAKTSRIPFSEYVNWQIEGFRERLKAEIDLEKHPEVDKLLKDLRIKWLAYAKERYPRAF